MRKYTWRRLKVLLFDVLEAAPFLPFTPPHPGMAASEEDLKTAHQRYNEALKLKSNRLPELDKWYREDLPALIKGRGNDAHLTTSELVKLMKWKLTVRRAYVCAIECDD
jgi:hypothetical protein